MTVNYKPILALVMLAYTSSYYAMDITHPAQNDIVTWIHTFLEEPNDGKRISDQELCERLVALSTCTNENAEILAFRAVLHQIVPRHLASQQIKLIAINPKRFISLTTPRYELLEEITSRDSSISDSNDNRIHLQLSNEPIVYNEKITSFHYSLQALLNGNIQLQDNENKDLIKEIVTPEANIRFVCFHISGKYMLTSTSDNSVILWNLSNFDAIQSIVLTDSENEIKNVGFGYGNQNKDYVIIVFTYGAGIRLIPLNFEGIFKDSSANQFANILDSYYS